MGTVSQRLKISDRKQVTVSWAKSWVSHCNQQSVGCVVPATAGSMGELGSEKAQEEIQIAINMCCLVIQEIKTMSYWVSSIGWTEIEEMLKR